MSQDVQTTAVGHPDERLAGASRRGALQQLVQHRNEHIEPFDREAFLSQIGAVQETLETLDLAQPLGQAPPSVRSQRNPVAAVLDRVDEPVALCRVLQLVDLVADSVTVHRPETIDHVIGSRAEALQIERSRRHASQLLLRDPVELRPQRRVAGRRGSERIQRNIQVSLLADSADQLSGDRGGLEELRIHQSRRFRSRRERSRRVVDGRGTIRGRPAIPEPIRESGRNGALFPQPTLSEVVRIARVVAVRRGRRSILGR